MKLIHPKLITFTTLDGTQPKKHIPVKSWSLPFSVYSIHNFSTTIRCRSWEDLSQRFGLGPLMTSPCDICHGHINCFTIKIHFLLVFLQSSLEQRRYPMGTPTWSEPTWLGFPTFQLRFLKKRMVATGEVIFLDEPCPQREEPLYCILLR